MRVPIDFKKRPSLDLEWILIIFNQQYTLINSSEYPPPTYIMISSIPHFPFNFTGMLVSLLWNLKVHQLWLSQPNYLLASCFSSIFPIPSNPFIGIISSQNVSMASFWFWRVFYPALYSYVKLFVVHDCGLDLHVLKVIHKNQGVRE